MLRMKWCFVCMNVFMGCCLFYGQDVRVRYNQMVPVIALKGRPQFGASPDHGRVFIPQTMVELDEMILTLLKLKAW